MSAKKGDLGGKVAIGGKHGSPKRTLLKMLKKCIEFYSPDLFLGLIQASFLILALEDETEKGKRRDILCTTLWQVALRLEKVKCIK